ncbi:PREDICTED: hexosaminidase D-like [Dufourea novaeangliae]|uniref:beta-N-acetylhexosaminidase n=1 Tax=Dufourea novaeangliae TaxID=178035 RepID=A0A154PIG2_DUFNO|nr:PREDICTED: hexosaminidase D-like [Dufourea novaeangliae]KZC10980.1 Hexosaminidase D [Dufourea novaeangliae]
MMRLRGRASLIVIIMISFTLLIVIYHILSNEVEDISSNKLNPRLKIEDVYPLSDLTESPRSIAKKLQIESHIMGKLKSGGGMLFGDLNYGRSYTDNAPLFKGHKIVHLDLKGAPPKVSYYKYLLKLLKKLGATGILIEYEDMFPFEGKIQDISAGNCYTKRDIENIQEIANENKLIVIPLVQTFGHMEFVLKLDKYKDYREVPHYPQALCPTHNKTLPLIYEMIDQVVAAHPEAKHLHIGADEVYQIGECSRCLDAMVKKQWGKKQLFLDHTSKVARYVKDKYPELTVLMWDDEFRDISPQEIIDRGLHLIVEPVVWKYTTDPGTYLTDQLWENYAAVWKHVWVATAFKGATAPDKYYTDVAYHMENHQRWLEIIKKYSTQITFKGVILTGWQRYDHFSVLCELLPSALPSLAVNLAILQAPDLSGFPMDIPTPIMQALQCEGSISLRTPEPQYSWTKCSYQGVSIYAAIFRLFSLTQEVTKMEQDNTFKGWLKPYNIKYSFSSPSHVERAVVDLDRHKMELMYIEKDMRSAMEDIYDDHTIQEWIETYLAPLNDKFTELWDAKEKILEKNVWPRRPLKKSEL